MCVYILLMMLGKIRDFAIRTHHLFQSIPQIYIHLIICFRFFFIFRLCVCLMLCRKHIYMFVRSQCAAKHKRLAREQGRWKARKKRYRTSILCSFVCECEMWMWMDAFVYVCCECEYDCIESLSHWTVWALAKSNSKLWGFECDTNARTHTQTCTQNVYKIW